MATLEYLDSISRDELVKLVDFYYANFPRSALKRLGAIDGYMDGHTASEMAQYESVTYCTIRTYLSEANRHIKSMRQGYKLK